MTIAALVSGGVDSSVMVHLLKEQGYDPHIFYIQIGAKDEEGFMDCPSEEDIEITSYIAKKYGCKFDVVNLHREYWDSVIDYTIRKVKDGFTPNPDVMCNRLIKFGQFEEKAGKDFDRIATGHYASTTVIDGETYLSTAHDKRKDQTYFLGLINHFQVAKAMFPVGHLDKPVLRDIAHQQALPSADRKDSTGICFLGKVNYNDFIQRYLGEKPGDIVELETGKILGRHRGYWFHTIGQRKGLGLSQGPWFVVDKNMTDNVVFVSRGYDPQSQYGDQVHLGDFSFITRDVWGDFDGGIDVKFKIRHTPDFTAGTIYKENGIYRIHSAEQIAGIAPGQFGVVYDKEEKLCLGGGEIILPA